MLTSFDEAGVQWAWDATSIKSAEACQRKYYYDIIASWERPGGNVHLWFGGIYASSLECYHKLIAGGSPREDAIREAIRYALIASWDREANAPRTFDNEYKNRFNLIRTLVWYFEEFKDEKLVTHTRADGTAAVEYSFQLHVDNGIVLCGHMDRVLHDEDGNIFIHDQKTTTYTISPHFFEGFKPDTQFSNYTFAGQAIFGIPIKGIMVDAAQVAIGFSRFARAPILFTQGELNEWYDETMDLIQRTQENTRNAWFPKNPASCGNYGGCPYRRICSRPREVRDNFLRADFEHRAERWDPIKAR